MGKWTKLSTDNGFRYDISSFIQKRTSPKFLNKGHNIIAGSIVSAWFMKFSTYFLICQIYQNLPFLSLSLYIYIYIYIYI